MSVKVAKAVTAAGNVVGVLADDGSFRPVLGASNVSEVLRRAIDGSLDELMGDPVQPLEFLAPVDAQEVWAAGVTYRRSRSAREQESQPTGAAVFYQSVYEADRPELFFKATAARVRGPGAAITVRADSDSTVPEPELAVWLDGDLRILGFALGNDVTARDIEAANPLYLPQAKIYDGACALGPFVLAADDPSAAADLVLKLCIERDGADVFVAEAPVADLRRPIQELVSWLGRDNSFVDGVVLLTGTGIVPPNDIHLCHGDVVSIAADGLGELRNPVRAGEGTP